MCWRISYLPRRRGCACPSAPSTPLGGRTLDAVIPPHPHFITSAPSTKRRHQLERPETRRVGLGGTVLSWPDQISPRTRFERPSIRRPTEGLVDCIWSS